jgi:hypothetical protein
VPGENTTDCLGWAVRLDYLLELAQQIREGRRLLNDGLLVGPRYLLAHDLDVVVSTAVIVPDFAAGNRISDSEIETLLRAGSASLIVKIKRSMVPFWKGLLIPCGDLRCCLPIVNRDAHRNPFFI